jgi:hypothetical protein
MTNSLPDLGALVRNLNLGIAQHKLRALYDLIIRLSKHSLTQKRKRCSSF